MLNRKSSLSQGNMHLTHKTKLKINKSCFEKTFIVHHWIHFYLNKKHTKQRCILEKSPKFQSAVYKEWRLCFCVFLRQTFPTYFYVSRMFFKIYLMWVLEPLPLKLQFLTLKHSLPWDLTCPWRAQYITEFVQAHTSSKLIFAGWIKCALYRGYSFNYVL